MRSLNSPSAKTITRQLDPAAQIGAQPASRATIERAIRCGDTGLRTLELEGQVAWRYPAGDMPPREWLVIGQDASGDAEQVDTGSPGRLLPDGEAEMLAPGIETRTALPCAFDDIAHLASATGYRGLDEGRRRLMPTEVDTLARQG